MSSDAPPPDARARDEAPALVADALRANDRYVGEVVEGFNVCPFARGARVSGRATREVLLLTTPDVAPVVEAIERFEAMGDTIEIVQLIFPGLKLAPRAYDEFVSRVRAARTAREPRCPFALAAFHPDYGLNMKTPDTLVVFFRKSPDPMIQLVRLSVIDALTRDGGSLMATDEMIERLLRGEAPPVSVAQKITRENFARVMRDGPEAIAAVYASIAAERVGRSPGER